jgi:hypothetical protein
MCLGAGEIYLSLLILLLLLLGKVKFSTIQNIRYASHTIKRVLLIIKTLSSLKQKLQFENLLSAMNFHFWVTLSVQESKSEVIKWREKKDKRAHKSHYLLPAT